LNIKDFANNTNTTLFKEDSYNSFTNSYSYINSNSQQYNESNLLKNKKISSLPANFIPYTKQENPNENIIKELEKLLDMYTKENNIFNVIAYRKAINVIKSFKEKITNYEQVKNTKFIGSAIVRKVINYILLNTYNESNNYFIVIG